MKHTCYFYLENLDSEYIDKLVTECLKMPNFNGKVGKKEIVNPKIRRSKIAFLDKNKHSKLYKKLYDLAVDANNQAYGFDINDMELLQFSLYEESNSGYYDWHFDTQWVDDTMRHRKISMSIQLSEPSDYEGGDLEIVDSNLTDEQKIGCRKKGSIITFPSFMSHRVTPVTKGKRMALVGWILGAKFR
tara:strand:+ start:742 stop:1305 length:564 start_codon:yes stop_codon:yes gene_type:complete